MFIWERSLNKVTQFSCFCWFSWVSKSFATRPVAEPNMRSKLKHLYFGVIESVQKRHRQFLKRFGEHRFLEILNPLKSERSLIIETLMHLRYELHKIWGFWPKIPHFPHFSQKSVQKNNTFRKHILALICTGLQSFGIQQKKFTIFHWRSKFSFPWRSKIFSPGVQT